jgi:zeaxanthin glucosyltransferase
MERGHDVTYLVSYIGTGGPALSFSATQQLIRSQGFTCMPFFEKETRRGVDAGSNQLYLFGPLVRGIALDDTITKLKPDLFITLTIFSLEALVLRFRYKTPVVLLRSHCTSLSRKQLCREAVTSRFMDVADGLPELMDLLVNANVTIKKLADIADLALEIPELILLPQEFASPDTNDDDRAHYIGAALLPALSQTAQNYVARSSLSSKLIYCSLGSQTHLQPGISCRFFRMAIDEIGTRTDIELIVSTGRGLDPQGLSPLPGNVRVTDWLSPPEVLKHADLMITHGGLGSVKECIAAGVPMIVVPMMRDQFSAAERVVHYGLGLRADVETLNGSDLSKLINRITANSSFRSRVREMSACFRRPIAEAAFRVIEGLTRGSALT